MGKPEFETLKTNFSSKQLVTYLSLHPQNKKPWIKNKQTSETTTLSSSGVKLALESSTPSKVPDIFSGQQYDFNLSSPINEKKKLKAKTEKH